MKLNISDRIDKSLKEWKKLFINELISKNSSNNTIKTYNRIIDDFIEYCYLESIEDNELKLEDINRYFLNSYIHNLKDRGLSPSTISLYIKVIKKLFMFITELNDDLIDIHKNIAKVSIKEEKKEVEIFSQKEIDLIKREIINNLEKSKNYTKFKNYLNIYFLLLTGMRAEESLNLKLEDIIDDGEFYKIKIFGKGNKERYNYIEKSDIEYFLEKLKDLREHNAISSQYLFATKDNKKSTYTALLRFHYRVLERIDVKKRGLHAFRHSLAERLVENNINLHTIKEWLGHSSIMTTSKYYAKTNERAKKSVVKFVS